VTNSVARGFALNVKLLAISERTLCSGDAPFGRPVLTVVRRVEESGNTSNDGDVVVKVHRP
jgi:hypothetical protein